jgi:hypothetical protein
VALAGLVTTVLVIGTADGAPATTSNTSLQNLGAALFRFPAFAAVPDSAALSVPVLAHGRLADTAGKPMGAAEILVSAWPANRVVHDLPIDGEVSLTPIARAVSGEDGSYQVRAALTPLLQSLTDRDGLDVEFDVFHAGRQYVYLSQVVPTAVGTWVGQLVTDVTRAAAPAAANPANLLDIALNPASGERLDADLLRMPAAARKPDFHHPAAPGCTNYEKAAVKDAWETIATAVARPGVATHVTYNSDAQTESSTGVAIDDGAFSVSGGRSRNSGIEATFHDHHADSGAVVNREYLVHMNHNVFRRACATDYQGHERVWWVTDPDGVSGADRLGGVDDRPSRYRVWDCAGNPRLEQIAHVDSISTHDERAVTYQGSFSFSPVPWATFQGDALSGYNKDVKVAFNFDDWQRGYWCGNTGFPAADGQRVQGYQR